MYKLYKKNNKKIYKKKKSSKIWLKRNFNDPYIINAKLQGYRSRSAYKILEIQKKYNIFNNRKNIVDLGAAPGGWSQIALNITSKKKIKSVIVGVDCIEIKPINGIKFLKMNFLNKDNHKILLDHLLDNPDLIISDIATSTIGQKTIDNIRQSYLFEMTVNFTFSYLKIGGSFLSKYFQTGLNNKFFEDLKIRFEKVYRIKPAASYKNSSETYIFAHNFKG